MPYYNVTPQTLYQSCMSSAWEWSGSDDPLTRARAWVEAENIYAMWKLVQEWFEMMESGEAFNRYPDPFWKDDDYPDKLPLTQDVVDIFIQEMDADFMLEKSRFQGRLAPEFARLPPHARMAFVQDSYKLIKTSSQIQKEAEGRLAAGETLPPAPRPR
ncbi:MAG: hypothetical protein L0177_19230 [Chloroflexi bacterium]|nr:hypothetical protein [Chloroflexota bacterium]